MSCVQEQPTGEPRIREKEFLRQLRIVLGEVDKTGVGKLRRIAEKLAESAMAGEGRSSLMPAWMC